MTNPTEGYAGLVAELRSLQAAPGRMNPPAGWALVFPDGSWCGTVYLEREKALQARDQAVLFGHPIADMSIVEVRPAPVLDWQEYERLRDDLWCFTHTYGLNHAITLEAKAALDALLAPFKGEERKT